MLHTQGPDSPAQLISGLGALPAAPAAWKVMSLDGAQRILQVSTDPEIAP